MRLLPRSSCVLFLALVAAGCGGGSGGGGGTTPFGTPTSRSLGVIPAATLSLDANRDGVDDVLVLGLGSGPGAASRFQVFLGGGGGLATTATQTGDLVPGLPAVALEPRGAVGDLDGDLDEDVVLTFRDNTLSPVHTLRNEGNGTFTAGFLQLQPTLFSGPPVLVTPLHADAGATLDLAVVLSPASTGGPFKLGFSLGNGAGVFAEIGDRLTLPREPASIGVCDVNGDGREEVVLEYRAPYGVEVYELTGGLVALSAGIAPFALGNSGFGVAAGDLNGDGRDEIVVGPTSAGPIPYHLPPASTLGILSPVSPPAPDLLGEKGIAMIGDVDGDGVPDLVLCVRTAVAEDVLTAYLGNGDRTFDPSALAVPLTSTLIGAGPLTGALGDIDGDGQLDVVFTDTGASPGTYVLRVVRHE